MDYICMEGEVSQPLGVEVAHADGSDAAFLVQLLHGPPGAVVVAHGLVDEVEVEVVQAKLVERGLEGSLGPLVGSILRPELGRDEKFLPVDLAVPDRLADGLLVHVGCGSVDQAVARPDRLDDGLPAHLTIGHLEDTETLEGHLDSVVQSCRLNFHVCVSPYLNSKELFSALLRLHRLRSRRH